MSPIHGDSCQRRLVERLSGWRLYAFLVIASVNLAILLALSWIAFDLPPRVSRLLIAVVTAQVSLFALSAGAVRFPIAVKISLISAVVLWAIWAVGGVHVRGRSSPEIADFFFLFLVQSLLLTIASTVVGWSRGYHGIARIGARELLILLSASAILVPLGQRVVWNWSDLSWSHWWGAMQLMGMATINAAWCVFVLCVYVRGILPRHRYTSAGVGSGNPVALRQVWVLFFQLAIVAVLLWSIEHFLLPGFVVPRTVYLAWLFVSMIPVVGLAVDSGRFADLPP